MRALAVKLVAIVQKVRIFAPPPSTSATIELELSTVDGKKVGTTYVNVAISVDAKTMGLAVEAAVKTYCTAAGIVVAANEVLLINEPMWRTF